MLAFCLALPFVAGCADGPFAELAAWNPWIRRQWRDDEQYGTTFYGRLDEFRSLRTAAARMNRQQQDHLAEQLIQVIRDESNPLLRLEAVKTLGALSTPAAFSGLRTALSDSDSDVRIAAIRAVGRRGDAESLRVLADVVGRDSDLDVRVAATTELGNFSDPRAVQALGLALDDADPAVQHRAVKSLKSAAGRDLGDSVSVWRDFVAGREPSRNEEPSLVQRLRNLF